MRERREQQEAIGRVVPDDELRHRNRGQLCQSGCRRRLSAELSSRRCRRSDPRRNLAGSTGSAVPLAAASYAAPTSRRAHGGQRGPHLAIRKHCVVVDDEAERGLPENVLELALCGSGG